MTVDVIDMYDATTLDVSTLPVGQQAAGYTTGVDVAWTEAQFAAHTSPYPAVRIDQDTGAKDYTADILDVETNAANLTEIVRWITNARVSFNDGTRPGQRWPGIYCGLNNLDQAVANLTAANITDVPFGIPDLTNRADAVTKVSTATGPYYRVWQQYLFGNTYDSGIVSVPWLTKVSTTMTDPTPPKVPASFSIPGVPGNWKVNSPVVITGLGPEGESLWIITTIDGKTFSKAEQVTL